MIEAVQERQALAEVSLRLRGTGRDRLCVGTQTFKQRFLGSEASERERQAQKDAAHPSRPSGAFVHDRVPSSRYKGSPVSEFQKFCFRNVIGPAIVGETRGSFVERDHGPLAKGAASFHTTRWMIVM